MSAIFSNMLCGGLILAKIMVCALRNILLYLPFKSRIIVYAKLMQQYGSNNIVLILKDTIFEHFEALSFSIKNILLN